MIVTHLRRTALAALFLTLTPLPLTAADVTVEAEAVKLENAKGKVVFCLWKEGQADAFPRCDKGTPVAMLSVDASTPKVAFKGLTPGAYAISMFHDEKGAGVPEYNFFGMPKSAIGLSNNPSIGLTAPPSFDKARFTVPSAAKISIEAKKLF